MFVFCLTWLTDLFVKLKHKTCFWLTVNSFPKSQMPANINVFKLFNLLLITPSVILQVVISFDP